MFQSFPVDAASTEEIVHQLSSCIDQYDVEVGLLPLGYCHNDHVYLQKLEERSKGAFKYLPVKSVFDMLSVISASDFFIGTSMHGNITAFTYGKPFLIAPTGRLKQQGFLRMAELDMWLELGKWSQIIERLEMIYNLNEDYFSSRQTVAKDKVHNAVESLLESILGDRVPS